MGCVGRCCGLHAMRGVVTDNEKMRFNTIFVAKRVRFIGYITWVGRYIKNIFGNFISKFVRQDANSRNIENDERPGPSFKVIDFKPQCQCIGIYYMIMID